MVLLVPITMNRRATLFKQGSRAVDIPGHYSILRNWRPWSIALVIVLGLALIGRLAYAM